MKNAIKGRLHMTLQSNKIIQTVVDFIIIAFAIFIVVKGMNSLKKKREEAPSEPPPPPKQEILLAEIRDLLKAK